MYIFLTWDSLEKKKHFKESIVTKCNFSLHIPAMFPHGNIDFFRNLQNPLYIRPWIFLYQVKMTKTTTYELI